MHDVKENISPFS